MAPQAADDQQSRDELVAYLFNRRETLLNSWRTACETDPDLKKVVVLSREEFNDLMPLILESLEQQLRGKQPETDPILAAQSHGLQRWQKSIELPSLLKEFSHLSTILFNELRLFRQLYPRVEPDVVLQAQQQIMVLVNEIIRGSITKHDELQRLEAANRATSLEQALQQMEELSRQRGDLLRTSSTICAVGWG